MREVWVIGLVSLGLGLHGCGGQADTSGNETGGSVSAAGGSSNGGLPASGGGPLRAGGSNASGGSSGSDGGSIGSGGTPIPTKEACEQSADCMVAPRGCCGACEPVQADQLQAVNRQWRDEDPACLDILCAACPPFEVDATTRKYFFASCEDHRCTLRDFRETEYAACTENTDCRLATGLGCCESCRAEDLLAFSSLEFRSGCEMVNCELCTLPDLPVSPKCNAETARCEVQWGP